MRDEIDERLYCNGPPVPISTSKVSTPKPVLHVEIVRTTPANKYQIQWIPSDNKYGGMYWDIHGTPFASVERYSNWLITGIAESNETRSHRENVNASKVDVSESNGISGCAKDNWFWIMIGISATIITLIISNNELAWLPKEMWAEYAGGYIFYIIYGLAHFAPIVMIFLGGWGVQSYCSTISCDRDHFVIGVSMILLTAGILIMYAILNAHQEGGWESMWESKDRMVEHAMDKE